RRELESLRLTVREYRDEVRANRETDKPAPRPEPAQPEAKQPQTVLVFKDGRQLDVENYAIVGGTLYDLSEGHTKKVALAELDLAATAKQNDERGVEFRVPAANWNVAAFLHCVADRLRLPECVRSKRIADFRDAAAFRVIYTAPRFS